MRLDIKILLILYIFAFMLSALLFTLKRIAAIKDFNNKITVDFIDVFILSLRLTCISTLPFLNIIYILIHTFGWNECVKDLKMDIKENDYRLC